MKKIFLAGAVIASCGLSAQPNFSWASSYATVCPSRGTCLAMEGSNTVINAGTYLGTGDFNSTPGGAFNLSTPGTPGPSDMYINKIDNGNAGFFWARRIRGTGAEIPTDIVCNTGVIYVVGFFNGTCQFDPAFVVPPVVSAGGDDIFVARYAAATGNFIGVTVIGGAGNDRASGVWLEPVSGDIFVSGGYTGVVNFNPAGLFNMGVAGDQNAFFMRYTGAGVFVNAWSIGGTGPDNALNIIMDGTGNVIVSGAFGSTACDFDPGVGATAINSTSVGVADAFVAHYTAATMALNWVRTFGTGDIDQGADVCTDPANNVYLTGTLGTLGTGFGTTGDIDPLTVGAQTITNPGTISGRSDIYILSFSPAGVLNWSRVMGDNWDDVGMSIGSDPGGTGWVWVTGSFMGTVDFAAGGGFPLTSGGAQDMYMMRYSYAGAFGTAGSVGAAGDDGAWDSWVDTTLNKIFITGQFWNTTDFDPTVGGVQWRVAPVGAQGTFLAAYDWSLLPPRLMGPQPPMGNAVGVYPNPSEGIVYVKDITAGEVVEMYSVEGKLCLSATVMNDGLFTLDAGTLENGLYILRVLHTNGETTAERVVIRR